jgi:hypothetical protein
MTSACIRIFGGQMLYYCRVFPVAQYTCMLSLYLQSGPERHGTIKCVPNPDPGPALSTRSRTPRKGKRHPRDRERRGPCSTQCDLLVKEWDYGYPTRRRESRWLSYLAAKIGVVRGSKATRSYENGRSWLSMSFFPCLVSSGRGWINSDI